MGDRDGILVLVSWPLLAKGCHQSLEGEQVGGVGRVVVVVVGITKE